MTMEIFMAAENTQFTDADEAILRAYSSLVDGLADFLGGGCEIVLHSLANLERSVIKIANGHYTGRKAGSPITDLALAMLARAQTEGLHDYFSYLNTSEKNGRMKSSTIIIRGTGGKPVGLLCINFYLDIPLSKIIDFFMPERIEQQRFTLIENHVTDTADLIASSVKQVKAAVDADKNIAVSQKNRQIIAELHARGIFQVKDSVNQVAGRLGISRNTVYMHLRSLKSQ